MYWIIGDFIINDESQGFSKILELYQQLYIVIYIYRSYINMRRMCIRDCIEINATASNKIHDIESM